MPRNSRTFRIFVSSTFSDLKQERNVLQKNVFPKLRALCRRHGCLFQAIDLRWGIRDEASLDQRTMEICLEEIKRCQRVTPRPNFLVLLGDRYGWCPPPHRIPASEFVAIMSHIISKEDKELLTAWYQCDENAVPPAYDLKPRTGVYSKKANWDPVEQKLRTILLKGIQQLNLKEKDQHKFQASATEQEIHYGVLKDENGADHVFCFFRTLTNLPANKLVAEYLDINADGTPDHDAQTRLAALKNRIEAKLGDNVFKYETEVSHQGLSTEYLNQFQYDVLISLENIIKKEIANFEKICPLEEEIAEQAVFRDQLISYFKGRECYLQDIENYINGSSPYPYIVHGLQGSGKSALLAKVAKLASKGDENKVILRFIDATPGSSDGSSLLDSLCRQIYQNFDLEKVKREELAKIRPDTGDPILSRRNITREYEIGSEYQQLSEAFRRFINKIPSQQKLVIIIDALDNLSENDRASHLNWLPSLLPTNIRIIVSCLTGKVLLKLERNLSRSISMQLDIMPVVEGMDLLESLLSSAGRRLQASQKQEVLNKFAQNGLPLYLKLAFEEARRWKSYSRDVTLSPAISGIIMDFFNRLSAPANHGNILVSRSMGYLASAKNGLTEDELIDILSLDPVVFKDFSESLHHELIDSKLPVVVWLRLYHDLEGYLAEGFADGIVVIRFYHRQLLEFVKSNYLKNSAKQNRHNLLAEYFGNQPLWQKEDSSRAPNLRKVSELPYQLIYAQLWDFVDKTLCDLNFIEAKCTARMTYELVTDFNEAIMALPENQYQNQIEGAASESLRKYAENLQKYAGGEITNLEFPSLDVIRKVVAREASPKQFKTTSKRRDRLKAFSKFVSTYSQTLFEYRHQPGFCVQQAYNSAISGPVSDAAERIIAEDNTSHMFLKIPSKRPHPDSTSCLSMVLVGHSSTVTCLRLSIDAKQALSGSSDFTLRQWNLKTGECIGVFYGHTDDITGIDLKADARIAVSVSYDDTIRIWDLGEHRCVRVIKAGGANCSVSLSPDGKNILSAGNGCYRIWTLNGKGYEGEELFRSPYEDTFPAVKISENGKLGFILKGEHLEVYSIPLWETLPAEKKVSRDFFTNDYLMRWYHNGAICFDTTPDNHRVVYGGFDNTLRLYDVEKNVCLDRFWGHQATINSVSITPNGRRAVSGSDDKTIRVWDLDQGTCLAILKGNQQTVKAVQISADGRTAISASDDGRIHLWDLGAITEPEGHTGSVISVAITSDGTRAVSISEDRTMRVWEISNGRCLKIIPLPDEVVKSVCISADARKAVTNSGAEIKLWNLENGTCVKTFIDRQRKPNFPNELFKPNPDNVGDASESDLKSLKRAELYKRKLEKSELIEFMKITDDGKKALAANQDSIKILDLEKGVFVQTITDKQSEVDSKELHLFFLEGDQWSDQKRRSFLRRNFVKISDGKIKVKSSKYSCITCVSMTPDGKLAITGSSDGKVKFWDLIKGKCLKVHKGHAAYVRCVNTTQNGKSAVSCDENGRLEFWNLEGDKAILPMDAESKYISSVYLSDNLDRVVAATTTEDLYVWDNEEGTRRGPFLRRILRGHSKPVSTLSVTPDGKIAVTGSIDGAITVFDLDKGVILSGSGRDETTGSVVRVDSTRDGQTIVSATLDQIAPRGGTANRVTMDRLTKEIFYEKGEKPQEGPLNSICFWQGTDGRRLSSSANLSNNLNSLAILPDGTITFFGYTHWLIARKKEGNEQLEFGGHQGKITLIKPSPDGRHVVTVDSDSIIRFWEVETQQCLKIMENVSKNITALDISPDGRIIVVPSGNTLRIIDLYQGTLIRDMSGHDDDIQCVKFSPDGKKVVTADAKFIRIWELRNATTTQCINGHTDRIRSLRISPDGRLVLSNSDDKTIRAWEMENGKCIAIYRDKNKLTQLSRLSPRWKFACGSQGNELLFLNGHNIPLDAPWVTAYRVGSISGNRKRNFERFGILYFLVALRRSMKRLSDDLVAFCPWCGQTLMVSIKIKNRIESISLHYGLSHSHSACLGLPQDAWEKSWLKSTCPLCEKPLQFTPFIREQLEFERPM